MSDYKLVPKSIVDELAQFIRKLDGNNNMGAGSLAEKICERFRVDVPDVQGEPVAFHMGDAADIVRLLATRQTARRVDRADLGPMGATEITTWETKTSLILELHVSNGGQTAYLYTTPQPAEQQPEPCQECGGDGAGGEHEEDCSMAQPAEQLEPVGWQFYESGRWWSGDDRIKGHRKYAEAAGLPVRDVYATPQPAPDVAAVHVDKQCREDVSAALGFIRGGNYTWSYLLQQIKDTVSVAEQQPDITRLIEWDALIAECEKLRNLLCYAQPIIQAHAGASHELVEAINVAIRGYDHDNQ